MSEHVLDLSQHHFCHQRGDLTVFGAWYGTEHSPCLVILPSFRMTADRARPLIIDLRDAYQWDPDSPHANPMMNRLMVNYFCDINFGDTNSLLAQRVVTLIHDHLLDLIKMPPKPTTGVVVGDAIRTDTDTGKVTHSEIVEHV